MLLLARTTPLADLKNESRKKTDGLSVFLIDLRAAGLENNTGPGITLHGPIRNMVNHETNEVFFDNFEKFPRKILSARKAGDSGISSTG